MLCEFYCLFCCCVLLKVRIHRKTIEIPAALATVAMAMAVLMLVEYIVIVLVVVATIFGVAVVLELFFSCSREVLAHDQDSETSMG